MACSRDHIMVFLIFFVFTVTVYNQATVSPELLNKASISVVDEDQSQLSARIIGAFYPPRFQPPEVITAGEMDRRMDQGTDTFALDIPPHFERDVLNGRGRRMKFSSTSTRRASGKPSPAAAMSRASSPARCSISSTAIAPEPRCPSISRCAHVFNPNLRECGLARSRASWRRSPCCRSCSRAPRSSASESMALSNICL